MHNGEASADDGSPRGSHDAASGAVAEAGTKQGRGLTKTVEVDASKLYIGDNALLGQRVKVYWAKEEGWFEGRVTAKADEEHYPALQIQYDDGDCEDVTFAENFTKIISKEENATGEASRIRFLNCRPIWAPGSSTPKAAEAAAAQAPPSRGRKRLLPADTDDDDDDDEDDDDHLDDVSSGDEFDASAETVAAAAEGKAAARVKARLESSKRRNLGQGRKAGFDRPGRQQSRGLKPQDGTPAGSAANSAGEISSESANAGEDSSSSEDDGDAVIEQQDAQGKSNQRKAAAAAGGGSGTGRKRGRPPKTAGSAAAAAGGGNKPKVGASRGLVRGSGSSNAAAAAAAFVRQPSPSRVQQQQQHAANKHRPQATPDQLKAAMKKAAEKAQQSQAARPKTVILDQRPLAGGAAAAAGANVVLRRVSSSANAAAGAPAPAAVAGRSPGGVLTSPAGTKPPAAAAGGGDSSETAAAAAKAAALQALLGGVAPAKPKAVTSVTKPRPHHQAVQQQLQQQKEQQRQQQVQKHAQQQVAGDASQKPAAVGGGSAAALAAVLAGGTSSGGGGSSSGGRSSAEIAAAAARRRAAEQAWAAVLAAMPVSGKGIKEVGSKALVMCSTIGPQRVVAAVMEQMQRLPPGPGRVNLLYLVDSALKQAHKLPEAQTNKHVADLSNKVSIGLSQMVNAAVYDLESLKKVRHLLGIWCQRGLIVTSYARPVHQHFAAFERDATKAMREAAEAAAHGIPAGMRTQKVILAIPEFPEDSKEGVTALPAAAAAAAVENGGSSAAYGVQPTAATAAAEGAGAVRDPRSKQQQQQQHGVVGDDEFAEVYGQAPGSPSEAILAALAAEMDEDGETQQPSGGKSSSIRKYPKYKNLFGPETIAGFLVNGYMSLHGLCQLPFSAAVNHLAAEKGSGSSAKQRDAIGNGFLLQLHVKGLQLQLAPDILADMDYRTDFVEESLADDRIGTWKQLLQPLDQAQEAERTAAAAAAGGSDQLATEQQQQQQGGSVEHWDEGDGADGRSGSYSSPLGLLVCPAAPKREERAEHSAYNRASAEDWGGLAAAVGFSFSQPNQGLGVTPTALGGQLGLGSSVGSMGGLAALDPGMLAIQRSQMVQAAMAAAQGLGLGGPTLGLQQQQHAVAAAAAAAGTGKTAVAAAPAWASQLDEMMQEQQEDEVLPPLPAEPAPSLETAAVTAAAAGGPERQQQQQQAPRRFVVPGALDDDEDDEDDLRQGPRRASAFMAADDDDEDDFAFAPPLPEGPPPEPSPDQPPLPDGLPPIPQETSPIYDPDEDDGQLPPLPAELPPSYGAGNIWPQLPGGVDYDMDSAVDDSYGSRYLQQQQQQGMGGLRMGVGMQGQVGSYGSGQQYLQQQQYMQQQQQMLMGQQASMGLNMGLQAAAAGANVVGQFGVGMPGQPPYWQQQQQAMQPSMYPQQPQHQQY